MSKKQVTFSFPADAWEGIVLANSIGYMEQVTKYNENGVPMQVDNPLSREDQAIENIINGISRPWKEMKLQEAIMATRQVAEQEVEARAIEVRAATDVEIVDIEEV